MNLAFVDKLAIVEIYIEAWVHWPGEGVYYSFSLNLYAFPMIVLLIGLFLIKLLYYPGPGVCIILNLHLVSNLAFFSISILCKFSIFQGYIFKHYIFLVPGFHLLSTTYAQIEEKLFLFSSLLIIKWSHGNGIN